MGGMASALERGFIQGEIARVAEARAGDIAHATSTNGIPTFSPTTASASSTPALRSRREGRHLGRPAAGAACWPSPSSTCATPPMPTSPEPASPAGIPRLPRRPSRRALRPRDLDAELLAAGRIEALSEPLHNSADAGKAFAASGAAIACLCSSDQVYAELAEASAGILKQAGAEQVLLAGRRSAGRPPSKAAGVDAFISAGADAVATLTKLHEALGVEVTGPIGRSPAPSYASRRRHANIAIRLSPHWRPTDHIEAGEHHGSGCKTARVPLHTGGCQCGAVPPSMPSRRRSASATAACAVAGPFTARCPWPTRLDPRPAGLRSNAPRGRRATSAPAAARRSLPASWAAPSSSC